MNKPSMPVEYQFFQNGKTEQVDAHVIAETPVSLTVNGQVWLTFMCSPLQLEALSVGFLFNEGIIDDFSEVADVRVCEHGDNVDVWLNHSAAKPERWTRTSGCTGGMTSLEALSVGFLFNEGIIDDFSEVADVRVCEHGDNVDVWLNHSAAKPERWTRTSGCTGGMTSVEARVDPGFADRQNNVMLSPEQIPALLEMLNGDQTLYRQTGGVHTSVLTDGERSILAAEDIGRHNTLDKLAGQILLNGIQPKAGVILTTGRISSEMMQKAIRLGASVVISRTSPSSMSVELAEKQGITLIGYAKRHRFNVYTHQERITENVETF